MHRILYPAVTTYWVVFYTGVPAIKSHFGICEPAQEFSSGATSMETFTDRALWIARAADFGITLT